MTNNFAMAMDADTLHEQALCAAMFPWLFTQHLLSSQTTQLFMHQRKQSISSYLISFLNRIQDTCDISHDSSRIWTSQQSATIVPRINR
jgi:hypothetical protein